MTCEKEIWMRRTKNLKLKVNAITSANNRRAEMMYYEQFNNVIVSLDGLKKAYKNVTTTVEVFAEDLITKLTYSVNLTVITGFEDPASRNVKVYPNPTKGTFKIEGVNNAMISVYTISGVMIYRFENSNGQTVDLSKHTNGIYIVRIEQNDFVSTKRIILSR